MKLIIIIQVVVAFVIGIGSLFVLYRLLNNYVKRKSEIAETNTAFAVFQVGILLAGSMIMSSVVSPAVNAIRFLNQGDVFNTQNCTTSLVYVAIFVAIGIICTIMVIAGGLFTFFQLTKVNEWEEIKQNSIPTSLISAAIIVGLALIMDEYVGHLCEALIPYPDVLQIR
jgi:uncharacterized membrane protein YjfL (UPF0719 family)